MTSFTPQERLGALPGAPYVEHPGVPDLASGFSKKMTGRTGHPADQRHIRQFDQLPEDQQAVSEQVFDGVTHLECPKCGCFIVQGFYTHHTGSKRCEAFASKEVHHTMTKNIKHYPADVKVIGPKYSRPRKKVAATPKVKAKSQPVVVERRGTIDSRVWLREMFPAGIPHDFYDMVKTWERLTDRLLEAEANHGE